MISTATARAPNSARPTIVRCLKSIRRFWKKSLYESADTRPGTERCPSGSRTMSNRAPDDVLKVKLSMLRCDVQVHIASIYIFHFWRQKIKVLHTFEVRMNNMQRQVLLKCLHYCLTVPGRTSKNVIIHRRQPVPVRNVTTHWNNVRIFPMPGDFDFQICWWVVNRWNRRASVLFGP